MSNFEHLPDTFKFCAMTGNFVFDQQPCQTVKGIRPRIDPVVFQVVSTHNTFHYNSNLGSI